MANRMDFHEFGYGPKTTLQGMWIYVSLFVHEEAAHHKHIRLNNLLQGIGQIAGDSLDKFIIP